MSECALIRKIASVPDLVIMTIWNPSFMFSSLAIILTYLAILFKKKLCMQSTISGLVIFGHSL